MVLAEQLGEPLGPLANAPQPLGRGRLEQPGGVPQVLGALAQLVQGLRGRILARDAVRAAPAAVDPVQAGAQVGHHVAVQRPGRDAVTTALELDGNLAERAALGVASEALGGRSLLGHQPLAQRRVALDAQLAGEAAEHCVEGVDNDLAIARVAEPAGGVAVGGVLRPRRVGTERRAGDAHRRAHALERLAHRVDRLGQLVVGRIGNDLERHVEPPAGDPAQVRGDRLVAAQAEGALGPAPAGRAALDARDSGGNEVASRGHTPVPAGVGKRLCPDHVVALAAAEVV